MDYFLSRSKCFFIMSSFHFMQLTGNLMAYAPLLLQAIPRPAPALRQVPDDILKRALQIAGLAVQAITEVHFYFIVLQFIHTRRAEHRAGRFII